MEKVREKILEYAKKQCLISCVKKQNVQSVVERVNHQLENVDFISKIRFKNVVSMGKRRRIAEMRDKLSAEYLLLKYFINEIPDLKKHGLQQMQVPTQRLLNALVQGQTKNEFTLIRFDFKNHYNNLSSGYVFEKYISKYKLLPVERQYLELYVNQVPYCFAGLCTSNFFAQVIDSALKTELAKNFSKLANSSCFQYGDDYCLYISQKIDKQKALELIDESVKNVFYDQSVKGVKPNKVSIHTSGDKFSLFTNDDLPFMFNFLGYDYHMFKTPTGFNFTYGAFQLSRDVFCDNLIAVIKKHKNNQVGLETLAKLHSTKVVYRRLALGSDFVSTKFNEQIKCLKLMPEKLDDISKDFLNNAISNCFKIALNENEEPKKLIDSKQEQTNLTPVKSENSAKINLDFLKKSEFCLFDNLVEKRKLLFDEEKGINRETLVSMCKSLNLDLDYDSCPYDKLATSLVDESKISY